MYLWQRTPHYFLNAFYVILGPVKWLHNNINVAIHNKSAANKNYSDRKR